MHRQCLRTSQQLDNCRKNEPLALLNPEELKDEGEEADAAQNSGQDHSSLHHLQVSCGAENNTVKHKLQQFQTYILYVFEAGKL